MADTLIIGCKTKAQSDEKRRNLGQLYDIVAVQEIGDLSVKNVPGTTWETAQYIVIATTKTIEGPFPKGPQSSGGAPEE